MRIPKLPYILFLFCAGIFNINAYSQSLLTDMQGYIKANAPNKPANNSPIKNSLQSMSDSIKPNTAHIDKLNLPINVYDKDIVLTMTIPKELKLTESKPGNPNIMVFKDKTTVIVVTNQTGGKYQAKNMIANGVARIQKDFQTTIMRSEVFTNPGFEDADYLLKLVDPKKNKTQFVFYYTISGLFDSAAIYIYKIMQPGEDPDAVADSVKELFYNNVTVIQTLKKDSDIPFYKEKYPIKIHVYDTVHEF